MWKPRYVKSIFDHQAFKGTILLSCQAKYQFRMSASLSSESPMSLRIHHKLFPRSDSGDGCKYLFILSDIFWNQEYTYWIVSQMAKWLYRILFWTCFAITYLLLSIYVSAFTIYGYAAGQTSKKGRFSFYRDLIVANYRRQALLSKCR